MGSKCNFVHQCKQIQSKSQRDSTDTGLPFFPTTSAKPWSSHAFLNFNNIKRSFGNF